MRPPVAGQQSVSDYFASTAAYWKNIYSDNKLLPVIYQDRRNTALGWIWQLDLRPSARILEVGCGAGLTSIALAQNGYTVEALDSTAEMLQLTRNDAVERAVQDRIRLLSGDVHALPFQEQTFDLVVAIGVIPWLHSERVAFQEMQRVLKAGGYLLVTADNNARLNRILDPLSSPLLAPLRLSAKKFLKGCGLSSLDVRFQPKKHYPRELDRMIGECNFTKSYIRYRWIWPIHPFWQNTSYGLDRCQITSAPPGACVETKDVSLALDRIPLLGVGDQGLKGQDYFARTIVWFAERWNAGCTPGQWKYR